LRWNKKQGMTDMEREREEIECATAVLYFHCLFIFFAAEIKKFSNFDFFHYSS